MTRDEALALGDRICDFLVSCGGAYTGLTGALQWNVFFALGSGQYVIKEDAEGIEWFASYWRVRQEDVESVVERVRPLDIKSGSTIYISEIGNKGGRHGMAEAIMALRAQEPNAKGVFWHRPAKKDKVYHYPHQRGKEVQNGH